MNIRWKRWLYPVVVLAIGGGIGFYMMSNRVSSLDASTEQQPIDPLADAPTVSVLTPVLAPNAPQLRLYSQLRSRQQVAINSPASAEILSVSVSEGDFVTAGQPLVQLDSAPLARQVSQLRSQRSNLQASWELDKQQHSSNLQSLEVEQRLVDIAQRSVDRLTDLRARNLSSDAEVESAERNLQNQLLSLQNRQLSVNRFQFLERQYQAQLSELDSKLEEAQEQLEDATVSAPFAGVVSNVSAQVGATPAAGESLMTLVDQSNQELVAWAAVNALDSAGSRSLTGVMDVSGQSVDVRLAYTDPAAESGSLRLFFNIDGAAPPMTINRYYPLFVNLPSLSSFAVPEESVYSNRYVYRVEENTLVRVPVTVVGERFEDGRLWRLVQGDLDGTKILVTRLQDVAQGMMVREAMSADQPIER